jgi:hypothetical protein
MKSETATTALNGATSPTSSEAIPTAGKSVTFVHVFSGGSSVATIKLQASVDGVHRKTVKVIENPDGEGELWELPSYPFLFVNATDVTEGEISAVVEVW